MILITGGSGYIGSHINKLLSKKGYETLVFDNLERGYLDFVKWGKFFKGDLRNINDIREVLNNYQIEAVMHFAAYAYVGESVFEPDKYYRNNVIGTLNLLTAMKEFGIKKIIFSSSCATYGVPIHIPIKEDTAQNSINPYGKSKLFSEQIIKDFARSYGFRYVILRYFNAAGADIDCEIGEMHEPETYLIPLAIRSILDKEFQLNVYGNDYPTKDGTFIRDYIHILDLAEAHLKALEYLSYKKYSDKFNVGTGQEYSIMDIINSIEKITGKKVNYKISKRRHGDPPVLVASNDKISKILGWKSKFNNIDIIVETAYRWHLKLWNKI